MPNKIKIFFGFLALIALFSVYSVFNSLGSKSSSVATISLQTPLPNPDDDLDHDGLTNQQEMIWNTDPFNPDTDGDGYLDGEEVASGHDPLKPGPNDILPINTTNVTDKVSALMVAGFYAGALDEKTNPDKYNQALADIGDSMIVDSMKALNPGNITVGKTIFSSDSKEAQEQYLKDVGTIIQDDLWGQLVNEPRVSATKFINFNSDDQQSINDSQQYFNTKAAYYRTIVEKLNIMAVPPSWIEIHQQILNGLRTLIINHQALGQTDNDPLKSIAAMSSLTSLYQNVPSIFVNIIQKIKTNHLNPPNGQLWTLINSLTDGL